MVNGTYVNAWARIHLYDYLDRLQKKTVYYNTDLVTYIQPAAETPLFNTGDCVLSYNVIGETGLSYGGICESGPKNYAYRIVDPETGKRETVCKFRGITQNYSASQTINFGVINALVFGGDDREIITVHTESKSKRKKADGRIHIVTDSECKFNRNLFLKRAPL